MKVRRSLLKDVVTVETRTGDGAYGPNYADPVTVRCNIDNRRRLVRNANGDEALSEASITVHPDDAAVFTPETRLTIEGRTSTVMNVRPLKLRSSVHHVEVSCT